jgi:MFS family permease
LSVKGKGAVLSTAASLASLLAALSCCLPLGMLLMAAGSAGAAMVSEALRPILIWVSALFLIVAFVQTYFRSRCEFRHRRLRTVLLWFSAVVVVMTIAAPRFTATLLAGRLPGFRGASELRTFAESDFLREFEAASAQTRLVILLSPT